MAKTASQIVDRALTLIDEVPTTFSTAATTETSIREQALEILPEVCRDLVKELPWGLKKYLADIAALTPITLQYGEDQSDYIKKKVSYPAPSDYWELVSMHLVVWSVPVTKYINIGDAEYAKQNNPFTRAGKQNPVVAITSIPPENTRIECFSINDGDDASINILEYIKFDNVPDDVGNTWPDELFDEVTKALAMELHIIKSRPDEAVIKSEEVKNAIEQH